MKTTLQSYSVTDLYLASINQWWSLETLHGVRKKTATLFFGHNFC